MADVVRDTANPSDPSHSSSSTPGSLPTDSLSSSKPVTMPFKRQAKLEQMLWHSLMEAKGQLVAVSTKSGETYSGILLAIEAKSSDAQSPNASSSSSSSTNTETVTTEGDAPNTSHHPYAWNKIVLQYVQRMSNPNANPADRIKAEYQEMKTIIASEFASLSAVAISDRSNSYRRAERQAFNDASGRSMHRKERELVRWEASGSVGDEYELRDEKDASNEPFDQFKANNVAATFDESMYTSNLDKSHPEYEKLAKEAAAMEANIMSKEATNKHVRDDRAYYSQNRKTQRSKVNGDEDEEDAYSRVLNNASSSSSVGGSSSSNSDDRETPSRPPPPSKSAGKHKEATRGGYVPPHKRNKLKSTKTPMQNNKGSILSLQRQRQQEGANRRNPSPNTNGSNPPSYGSAPASIASPNKPNAPSPTDSTNAMHTATSNAQDVSATNPAMQAVNGQVVVNSEQLQQYAQLLQTQQSQGLYAAMLGGQQQSYLQPAQQMNTLKQFQSRLNNMIGAGNNPAAAAQASITDVAPKSMSPSESVHKSNDETPGNEASNVEGSTATGSNETGAKDGDLNPNAIEFTPQIAARPTSTTATAAAMNPQNQQQTIQAQAAHLMMGQPAQYSYNHAIGQYVLTPMVAPQNTASASYLNQLAIQQAQATQMAQQLATQNGQTQDPQKLVQQQLLAYQQFMQQQQLQQQAVQLQQAQQAQLQAAQGQGQLRGGVNQVGQLNIGAPMFKPSPVNPVASPNAALLQQQQQQQHQQAMMQQPFMAVQVLQQQQSPQHQQHQQHQQQQHQQQQQAGGHNPQFAMLQQYQQQQQYFMQQHHAHNAH